MKKRWRADELMDKPQLHSDCVPRPAPQELDAGQRHELSANLQAEPSELASETFGANNGVCGRSESKS